MSHQIAHPNPMPDDLHPAVDALIGRLRSRYPDMSGFTAVSMTGRGRDFLHHQIHTRIGGLLPAILSYEDYRTRRLGDSLGRTAVTDDEAFLRFHAFSSRRQGRVVAPSDSQRLLAFLAAIAEFAVSPAELRALDRIGPEQLERIDGFFALQDGFRSSLAAEGFFYPPFEAERFADLAPNEGDLFFGLPLMTPANERFFRCIPQERLFSDAPLFGPHMPTDQPEYETALSLMRRLGLTEKRGDGSGLAFSELAERAGFPALLSQEIAAFLAQPRHEGEQLFIVPLDERLSLR